MIETLVSTALGVALDRAAAATAAQFSVDKQTLSLLRSDVLVSDDLMLSGEQNAELAEVLSSNEFVALGNSFALAKALTSPEGAPEAEEELQRLAISAFTQVVQLLKPDAVWLESCTEIWQQLLEPSFDFVKQGQLLRVMTAQQQNSIDKTLAAGESSSLPRFARLALTALGDTSALHRLSALHSDIRMATPHAFNDLKLRHISGDRRPAGLRQRATDLYIERTLKQVEGRAISSLAASGELAFEDLVRTSFPALRAVVVGDPGVGKSTLVERTASRLAGDGDFAPIVLRCRDLNGHMNLPVFEALAAGVQKDLSVVDATAKSVEDLCALGRIFVIFDGLDEITTPVEREALATKIRVFCASHPATPVLVTARKIGYSADWLDQRSFTKLLLAEFSSEQVAEYARTWFERIAERPELSVPFLSEVASLGEIRNNPLILSLICSVYVDQGYIPRNRREIYRECSLLLMRKWDSQRQIAVPFDHLEYGMKIMRDLGDFFAKHSRNAGVEERQLRMLLTGFFEQTAGVDRDIAAERAQDFLDYCADRTWLLSRVGTNAAGDRLFGFTHQTFREYFEAEALVRRVKEPESVALHLYDIYKQNPSSVMPELIVQAFDEVNEGELGALPRRLLRLQNQRLSPIKLDGYTLLLRLVNSSPVGAAVMDEVLDSFLSSGHERSGAEAAIFFSLYRDPRARALKVAARKNRNVLQRLSVEYASLILSGRLPRVDSEWLDPLRLVHDEAGALPVVWLHLLTECALVGSSDLVRRVVSSSEPLSPVIHRDVWGTSYSVLLRCLSRLASSPSFVLSSDMDLFSRLVTLGVDDYRLPENLAGALVAESDETVANWDTGQREGLEVLLASTQSVRDLVVWLACLSFETDPTRISLMQNVMDVWQGAPAWREAIRVGIDDESEIAQIRSGREVGAAVGAMMLRMSEPVASAWLRGAQFVGQGQHGAYLKQRRRVRERA